MREIPKAKNQNSNGPHDLGQISANRAGKRYRGKYPGRIQSIGSCCGDSRTFLIITNDDRRFTFKRLHKDAPFPVPGMEIEEIEFFVDEVK